MTTHRRFGGDPQLVDFLPNFLNLAPFGPALGNAHFLVAFLISGGRTEDIGNKLTGNIG